MRTEPNPRVIAWALERCHKTPADLRSSVSPRVQEWIDGVGRPPTRKQVEKLARATHVLAPYFYLEDIPELPLQIHDYRTKDSGEPRNPSPELYDVINKMLSRQDWLKEYLDDIGADPLDFIGSCHDIPDDKACAAKMRELLKLSQGWASNLRADDAVRQLRAAIEATGVYVCAGSYYANSTKRRFSVDEFRGFVLADAYAPIIFLNTADTKSAQLFTLAHEFAHLLFAETGVDDIPYSAHGKSSHETRCDAVAAEFLLPATIVNETFDAMETDEALERLRGLTKVSPIVCLRRALDLGRIPRREFLARYDEYASHLPELLEKKQRMEGSKPTFFILAKNHLGGLFPERIYEALRSENLLYTDAYRLTDLTASSFGKFFRQEGMHV